MGRRQFWSISLAMLTCFSQLGLPPGVAEAEVSSPATYPADDSEDASNAGPWRGLSFDEAAFDEVVAIARTFHLSANLSDTAWRKAIERFLKGLEPRAVVVPHRDWQSLRRDQQGRLRLADVVHPLPCGDPPLALAYMATPTEPSETARQRREERRQLRVWQAQVAAANQSIRVDRAGLQSAMRWADKSLPALQQPVQRAASWRRAAQGLLEGLDPHSSLIPRTQFEQAERQSAQKLSADAGFLVERDGPDLYVSSIHPQAKVALQKLKLGDRILAVDGQSTADWSAARAAQQLAATPDHSGPVSLVVAPARPTGKPAFRTVALPRVELQWPTVVVRAAHRALQVAVVRLPQFARLTADQVRQGLSTAAALLGKPLRAVVLDMRGNGGGWLSEAIAVADLFIRSGTLLTVRWRGLEDERYVAREQGDDLQMPIAVLVDGHCRSACEVVADALQGTGRAPVVGQRTFGKGTLQVVEDAQRGPWAVLVTRGIYAGPTGRSLQARGVEPDLPAGTEEALLREVDLPRALTAGDDLPPRPSAWQTDAWRACATTSLPALAALEAYDPPLATAVRAALCQGEPPTKPDRGRRR